MNSSNFIFDIHTKILVECEQEEGSNVLSSCAVLNAISILDRDIKEAFCQIPKGDESRIYLQYHSGMIEEAYQLYVKTDAISVCAGDELGFVYALLEISRRFLKREPFWFWMNQKLDPVDRYLIPEQTIASPTYRIRYRGWFFNDEVLLSHWNYEGSNENSFRLAYETLLRCGGNMVIPGTDLVGLKYRKLASDMGLYITHHHAEPLGAEMFARAYPDERPSFSENQKLFVKLWEDAIEQQKHNKTIFALGFRGQGDCPFWSNDESGDFDTDEKRGKLISQLIRMQRKMVEQKVEHPVFCTNLYGEIMELYDQGYLDIDDDIIKIYADNGYGKMVTRRRDDHPGRVVALPRKGTDVSGIYYHVSFYDLQAANHITMLANSVDFVNRELDEALQKGAGAYWLINCSNILPHVYYLDAVRRKWKGEALSDKTHSKAFTDTYFRGNTTLAHLYETHAKITVSFGIHEDEHAGEQFYTENPRILAYHLIRGERTPAKELFWYTKRESLKEQLDDIAKALEPAIPRMEQFEAECQKAYEGLNENEQQAFLTTLYLDARIHAQCAKGMLYFIEGVREYLKDSYWKAFYQLGLSAREYEKANEWMRECEYGKLQGFFANDCFADIKHTAYMIRKLMGVARELGDNVRHDTWYRSLKYKKEDQQIFTQLVLDNHMTDEELWTAMEEKQ